MDFPCTQLYTNENDCSPTKKLDLSTLRTGHKQVGILQVGDETYKIKAGVNIVGRHPDCNITLTDSTISKQHVEIEGTTSQKPAWISDLNSSNKTILNNVVLRAGRCYELKHGSVIEFGRVKAVYKYLQAPEESLAPEEKVIAATPDSSLNNSSTLAGDVSAIPGTQDFLTTFSRPLLPHQHKVVHSLATTRTLTNSTTSFSEATSSTCDRSIFPDSDNDLSTCEASFRNKSHMETADAQLGRDICRESDDDADITGQPSTSVASSIRASSRNNSPVGTPIGTNCADLSRGIDIHDIETQKQFHSTDDIHEMETQQVVLNDVRQNRTCINSPNEVPPDIHTMETQGFIKRKSPDPNQANILDIHDVETQQVVLNDVGQNRTHVNSQKAVPPDIHTMETQGFIKRTSPDPNQGNILDIHDVETQQMVLNDVRQSRNYINSQKAVPHDIHTMETQGVINRKSPNPNQGNVLDIHEMETQRPDDIPLISRRLTISPERESQTGVQETNNKSVSHEIREAELQNSDLVNLEANERRSNSPSDSLEGPGSPQEVLKLSVETNFEDACKELDLSVTNASSQNLLENLANEEMHDGLNDGSPHRSPSIVSKVRNLSAASSEDDDIFEAATQRASVDEEDIFNAMTQRVNYKARDAIESDGSETDEEGVFQKLVGKSSMEAIKGSETSSTVDKPICNNDKEIESELHTCETQKIDRYESDKRWAGTNADNVDDDSVTDEEGIFTEFSKKESRGKVPSPEAEQQICLQENNDCSNSRDSDDIFALPTQVFNSGAKDRETSADAVLQSDDESNELEKTIKVSNRTCTLNDKDTATSTEEGSVLQKVGTPVALDIDDMAATQVIHVPESNKKCVKEKESQETVLQTASNVDDMAETQLIYVGSNESPLSSQHFLMSDTPPSRSKECRASPVNSQANIEVKKSALKSAKDKMSGTVSKIALRVDDAAPKDAVSVASNESSLNNPQKTEAQQRKSKKGRTTPISSWFRCKTNEPALRVSKGESSGISGLGTIPDTIDMAPTQVIYGANDDSSANSPSNALIIDTDPGDSNGSEPSTSNASPWQSELRKKATLNTADSGDTSDGYSSDASGLYSTQKCGIEDIAYEMAPTQIISDINAEKSKKPTKNGTANNEKDKPKKKAKVSTNETFERNPNDNFDASDRQNGRDEAANKVQGDNEDNKEGKRSHAKREKKGQIKTKAPKEIKTKAKKREANTTEILEDIGGSKRTRRSSVANNTRQSPSIRNFFPTKDSPLTVERPQSPIPLKEKDKNSKGITGTSSKSTEALDTSSKRSVLKNEKQEVTKSPLTVKRPQSPIPFKEKDKNNKRITGSTRRGTEAVDKPIKRSVRKSEKQEVAKPPLTVEPLQSPIPFKEKDENNKGITGTSSKTTEALDTSSKRRVPKNEKEEVTKSRSSTPLRKNTVRKNSAIPPPISSEESQEVAIIMEASTSLESKANLDMKQTNEAEPAMEKAKGRRNLRKRLNPNDSESVDTKESSTVSEVLASEPPSFEVPGPKPKRLKLNHSTPAAVETSAAKPQRRGRPPKSSQSSQRTLNESYVENSLNFSKQLDTLNSSVSSVANRSTTRLNRSMSISMTSQSSASGNKQKILFTGIANTTSYNKILTQLGGSIVDSPTKCSVLVTDKVRRTVKFLCALAHGTPIVSIDWLRDSNKMGRFADMDAYTLSDLETEEKFSFKLKASLVKAQRHKLLDGYTVVLTPKVTSPPIAELKSIISACGGKPLLSAPKSWPVKSVIISSQEDIGSARKFILKAPKTVTVQSTEFLLTGILQQELDFAKYKLI